MSAPTMSMLEAAHLLNRSLTTPALFDEAMTDEMASEQSITPHEALLERTVSALEMCFLIGCSATESDDAVEAAAAEDSEAPVPTACALLKHVGRSVTAPLLIDDEEACEGESSSESGNLPTPAREPLDRRVLTAVDMAYLVGCAAMAAAGSVHDDAETETTQLGTTVSSYGTNETAPQDEEKKVRRRGCRGSGARRRRREAAIARAAAKAQRSSVCWCDVESEDEE